MSGTVDHGARKAGGARVGGCVLVCVGGAGEAELRVSVRGWLRVGGGGAV